MKKAFNLKIIDCRNLDKPTAYCGKLPLPGERVGVRGQQALTKAFTLAEVLITLAIIGVVAAMAIPSVISNAQQQEFKTGLRKAVSVLNSAITMNIALDGESPYDNHDLFRYLQRHMNIMKSTSSVPWQYRVISHDGRVLGQTSSYKGNAAFYTTDGMRFEFYRNGNRCTKNADISYSIGATYLHENEVRSHICTYVTDEGVNPNFRCGSYGLTNNHSNTTATPCLITVDVNGDRKPYPVNAQAVNMNNNELKLETPNSKKVKDMFSIIITEDRAIPFGVLAQKAMYQAQK